MLGKGEEGMAQYDDATIWKFNLVTADGTLIIPKGLIRCGKVCEEAKMIFAEVLTENRLNTVAEVKAALYGVNDGYIKAYREIYNNRHTSSRIRSDLNWTADNIIALFEDMEAV